jgi:hypothetical protein
VSQCAYSIPSFADNFTLTVEPRTFPPNAVYVRATSNGTLTPDRFYLVVALLKHASHAARASPQSRRKFHQRDLQQVQRQHGAPPGFPIRSGQFGVLAVEDRPVGGVPLFDDLQTFVDPAA